jgi:hypothetical protein
MTERGDGARRRSSDRRRLPTGPIECPWCGEVRGARVSFGFPAWNAELEAAMARGEVVLGGCIIDVASPGWRCGACRRSWGVRDPHAWAWEIAEGRGERETGGGADRGGDPYLRAAVEAATVLIDLFADPVRAAFDRTGAIPSWPSDAELEAVLRWAAGREDAAVGREDAATGLDADEWPRDRPTTPFEQALEGAILQGEAAGRA